MSADAASAPERSRTSCCCASVRNTCSPRTWAPGYADAARQSQQGFAPLAPADEPAVQPPLAAEQPTAPGPRTLGTVAATDREALRSQALELQRGDDTAETAPAPSANPGCRTCAGCRRCSR